MKIHVIFVENLVTKKLHHTEEWTGLLSKNSHSSTLLLLTPCLGHVWKSIDMNSFEEAEDIQATIHLRCKVMDRVSVGSGVFASFGSGFGFQISLDPVSARILEQKKRVQKGL